MQVGSPKLAQVGAHFGSTEANLEVQRPTWSPTWSNWAPTWPYVGLPWAQLGPKLAPSWPKLGQLGLQDGLKLGLSWDHSASMLHFAVNSKNIKKNIVF